MGIKGVGLSIGLANLMIFTGLNIYPLCVKEARGAMRLPTWAAFRNLKEYLRKGVPLSLMIFVEWLAFEFLILMSGALGVAEQATQTIVLNTTILFFGVVVGIQTAMACLIGQQIGSQNVDKARGYYRVGKLIAFVQISLTGLFFYSANEWILSLFTDRAEVKKLWDQVIIIVTLSLLADHWQSFYQGVIRGLGI